MAQFSPDFCTFGDRPGMGYFDAGHHREHLQFVEVLAGQTPPVLIPAYDFLSFLTASDHKSAIESHQSIHELLADITGITAPDFSGYDLKDANSFYGFCQDHATTHAQIRQALGIV